MNLEKIKNQIEDCPDYRKQQVKKSLFSRGIKDWDQATSLPKNLRKKLKQEIPLSIEADLFESEDGKTSKASIQLKDGCRIETVLMKIDEERNTVCVSTQIGCSLGCEFCATGKMGFKRNLKTGEIINQVYYFLRRLKPDERVDNVVFMGMGEPFLNYDNVMEAIKILNDKNSFNIAARNLSISTAGIPSGIKKISHEPMQINLAISLHAADNEKRSTIMPINRKYSLENIFDAVDYYIEKTNRKIMFEYIPFKGFNDTQKDINNLTTLLKNRLHFINLIPYNPTEGKLEGASMKNIIKFKDELLKRDLNAGIRKSYGQDIKGACGQLVNE